jgi:thioredoxin 1
MQELRVETLEPAIGRGIVIVDCWAPWCDPCRAFRAVYDAASTRHPGVTFASVNAERQPGIASALRISTVPTVLAFRDRILVYMHSGFMLAEALDALVQSVRRLDMTTVRRKLAAFAV